MECADCGQEQIQGYEAAPDTRSLVVVELLFLFPMDIREVVCSLIQIVIRETMNAVNVFGWRIDRGKRSPQKKSCGDKIA